MYTNKEIVTKVGTMQLDLNLKSKYCNVWCSSRVTVYSIKTECTFISIVNVECEHYKQITTP